MILPIEYHKAAATDPDEEYRVPTILVVDDDPGLRKALSIFLKFQYFVVSASSAEEATMLLEELGADAVILDYKMPGKDGLELLRSIRSRYPKLPVLLLSGCADESTEQRAKTLGVNGCMRKPFELEEVVGSLAELVRVRGDTEHPNWDLSL